MDRDKELLYFKQLRFTYAAPLHVNGEQLYMSARHRLGDVWDNTITTAREQPTVVKGQDGGYPRPLQISSLSPEDKKKNAQSFAQRFTSLTVSSDCTCCQKSSRAPVDSTSSRQEADLTAEACAISDDDSDEEGISLDRLLQLMGRLHQRPCPQGGSSTLVRLAACFSPTDTLTDEHVNKLLMFLDCEHTVLKETCLRIVERLLAQNKGCVVLMQSSELVNRVIDLVKDISQGSGIQVIAMCVLDKMLNMVELEYHQFQQRLEAEVYPSILQCLQGNAALDVKYAACCVMRSLAKDIDFAIRVKKESLFLLRQLQYSSARLKEVYVDVLMALFSHTGLAEPGSVDSGILPVLKGLLRDGPCETQKHALELLQCVMSDDKGVEAVAGDLRMVTSILACLLSTKCRKVRARACLVLSTLTSAHKVGIIRSVLEAIGHYITTMQSTEAGAEGGGVKALSNYPVLAKNQSEILMWHNLDRFLDSVAGLLHCEGLISMKMDCLHSELPVKGEVSGEQLSCLCYLLHVMVNISTWPLRRRDVGLGNAQVTPLDLTNLADDLAVRERFSTLNHRLAVQQWKRLGPSVFAILRWMSQRIAAHINHTTATDIVSPNDCQPPASVVSSTSCTSSQPRSMAQTSRHPSAKLCSIAAKDILTDSEQDLVHALLSFVLCMTLVTCKRIVDPLCEEAEESQEDCSCEVSSEVKRTANKEMSNGLWVNSNPYLTQSVGRAGPSLEDMARKQQEDAEWEAVADRKRLRRDMLNEGLFQMMAPFLQLTDTEIKVVCCLILRTAVQPLEEVNARPRPSGKEDGGESGTITCVGPPSLNSVSGDRRRPKSAMQAPGPRETERQLNMAHLQMSSASAAVVSDALGPRPYSANKLPSEVLTPCSKSSSSTKRCQSQLSVYPLVAGQPISKECQREAAVTCGRHVIHSLFCQSRSIKFSSLAFLYDLIRFTMVPVHMELSKCGIIPKLLDFIRVSDDDEQLEILALKTLGLLTSSDFRLQQLFSHHGGHTLLTALTRNTNPSIRDQVRATLATVTKGHRPDGQGAQGRRQRPASAPVSRWASCPASVPNAPRDIWEHIMQRWAQEDQVVEVLKQFL